MFLEPLACEPQVYEIKKSRFIAQLHRSDSRESHHAVLAGVRAAYPDAGHVCCAYRLGGDNNIAAEGCNDDGEPSGTAGKPILNVLQHSSLGNTTITVVRYFGGVKLGAGGLVRAYSASAKQALDNTVTQTFIPMKTLSVTLPFSREADLRQRLDKAGAEVLSVKYTESVVMTLTLPIAALADLKALSYLKTL